MTTDDSRDKFSRLEFELKPEAYFRALRRRLPDGDVTPRVALASHHRRLAEPMPDPPGRNYTGRYQSDDGLVSVQINHVGSFAVIWTTARFDLMHGTREPDMRELSGSFEDGIATESAPLFRLYNAEDPGTWLGVVMLHEDNTIVLARGDWVVNLRRTTNRPTISLERLRAMPERVGKLLKFAERFPLVPPQVENLDTLASGVARAIRLFWSTTASDHVDERFAGRMAFAQAIAKVQFQTYAKWPPSEEFVRVRIYDPDFPWMNAWGFRHQTEQASAHVVSMLAATEIPMPGAQRSMRRAFFGQAGASRPRSALDGLLMLVHECEAHTELGHGVDTRAIRRTFGLGPRSALVQPIHYSAHVEMTQAGVSGRIFGASLMGGSLSLTIGQERPVRYDIGLVAGSVGLSEGHMVGSDNTGDAYSPFRWDTEDLQGPVELHDLQVAGAAGDVGGSYGSTMLILFGNGAHPPLALDLGGTGGATGFGRRGGSFFAGLTMARGAIVLHEDAPARVTPRDVPTRTPYVATGASLNTLNFERLGQAILTPVGRATLRSIVAYELAAFMDRNGSLELVGHADRVDTEERNIELSRLRALNVKQAIVDMLGTNPDVNIPDEHLTAQCENGRAEHLARGVHMRWLGESEAGYYTRDSTPDLAFRKVDITIGGLIRFVLADP